MENLRPSRNPPVILRGQEKRHGLQGSIAYLQRLLRNLQPSRVRSVRSSDRMVLG
jgi:hypothetical protein